MRIHQSAGKNLLKGIMLSLTTFSLLIFFTASPLQVAAAPTAPAGNSSQISPKGLPTVEPSQDTVDNKILPVVFGIIGSFALLGITLSGLKYITSAGNPQKTSEAKNGIVYSLVGLAIAITAEAIVAFVVNRASP